MKKKVLAAMLVAAMTATMFAGCGSKDEGTTGTQAANNGSTSESAEPVDVKLTVMDLLKIRMMHRGMVKDRV